MQKTYSIGLGTILFIIFLVLKLTGNIAWSWWWVTSPLWIPFVIFFGVILGLIVFTCIMWFLVSLFKFIFNQY